MSGEEDHTPFALTDPWFESGGRLAHSNCGEVKWVNLGVEPPPDDPTFLVRILDLGTGLYWHRAGFAWNASCGGVPPQHWSGGKEITLVDWAGNESEPAGARVCGCSETSGSAVPLSLLLAVVLCGRVSRRVGS